MREAATVRAMRGGERHGGHRGCYAAAVVLLVLACLSPGCVNHRGGDQGLVVAPVVTDIKEIEAVDWASLAAPATQGNAAASEVPGGTLPKGWSDVWWFPGGRWSLAVGERVGQNGIEREVGLWVFDRDRRCVGRVSGIPTAGIEDARDVRAAWDSSGNRVAVWFAVPGAPRHSIIGVVKVSSLVMEVVHEWPLAKMDLARSGLDVLVWSRDAVIVVRSRQGRNAVEAVQPSTGVVRTLLSEESWRPIWHVAVSPQGRVIGFDKFLGHRRGPFGTYLVEVASGRVFQLTGERGLSYHHMLVGLESENAAIVVVSPFSEHSRWYRVRFDLSQRGASIEQSADEVEANSTPRPR